MDAILDHAFERYFATSGLFGTVERCRQMVARLTAIGVDEIACLIDFGVATEQVLDSLPRLKQLMDATAADKRPADRAAVAEDVGEFVPLGTPIANTSLHVLDPAGRECPALITGELCIGGAGVARGYLGRPELTEERFVRDPFADNASARLYRTGDLVRRHPDGTLEFIGRVDNQVKIRGHRVELGEIEAVLASQPGVKEAVVHARHDDAGNQQLLACVTPRTGVALDGQALR